MKSFRRLGALMLVLAACGSLPAAAWAVDNTPPTVTFTGGVGVAPHLTNAAVPEVSFTAGDVSGIQSVQCKVDAGAYADCSTPYTMPGLAEGGHTVFVKATDASAVHNTFTRSAAFIVDRTPPVVSLPDAITVNDSVSWGYSDAHGPVTSRCAFATSTPAPGSGTPCTTANTLNVLSSVPGVYHLAVRVTDGAGNYTDNAATVTIDRAFPTVEIGATPSNTTPSNEVRPTFQLKFTDDSGGIASAQCAIDRAPAGPTDACEDTPTTGSFTPSSDLSEGGHVFEVEVTDGAGKKATAFRSFVVDTTPPVVTFDGQSGAYLNGALGFTVSDAMSQITTLTCDLGAVLDPCDPPISLAGLGDGEHTITVHAADAAGNTTTPAPQFLVRVDRTPPTLALTAIQIDGSTATVSFTSGDAAFPASVTRQCRVDGGAFGPCSSDSSHTVGDLAPGPHAVEVLVVDGAGNTSLGRGEFTIGEPAGATTTTTTTTGTTSTTTTGGTTDTSPALSARLRIDRPKGGPTRNRLLVKCDEACALTVTLSDRKGKRLARVTKHLLRGKQAAILLRVPASAFKGKHSLKVKLGLRAVDKAGNPTTESRFITLRR